VQSTTPKNQQKYEGKKKGKNNNKKKNPSEHIKAQKNKIPMSGEKINERKNIPAWYVRKNTTLNIVPTLLRFINKSNKGLLLPN